VARTAVAAGRRGARRRPAVLHDPRFVDLAPAEVYATLLDAGQYLCSERTMYRVLAANREVRERRNQLRHPHYAAPELLARQRNELWSWDITKLPGRLALQLSRGASGSLVTDRSKTQPLTTHVPVNHLKC